MNFITTIKTNLKLKNENELYFIFLSFFMFVLPLYKISASPILIILSIAILFKLFKTKYKILKVFVNTKISILFLLLFSIVLTSFFYSSNMNNTIKEVKNLLPLLIFPLLFSYIKLKDKQIIFILKSFILGCLVAFFVSIGSQLFHYFNSQEYSFHYSKFVAILWMHPTYLSIYLNFGILVSYYLVIRKNISLRYFVFAISVFIIFILLLSARMQIINSVIVFAFIFIHFLKNNFSLKVFFSLLLIPLFILIFALNNQKTIDRFTYIQNFNYKLESTKNKDWNGVNVRLAIWECAAGLIKENILFGVGVGDENEELLKAFKNRNFNFAHNLNYVAHNQYIQFLISNGIIGLFSYLAIFIYSFCYAIRNRHFLLFGLSFILLFSGFTESFLKMQSGIVFFSFMIIFLFHYKTFDSN
tara:strand:+ start:121 stop:1365 length:1245 start_codon:yes stop_codon:yes gene_type:complete